jgi:dipeptidyl aminopeptidase/acylaminoacyl peptidase
MNITFLTALTSILLLSQSLIGCGRSTDRQNSINSDQSTTGSEDSKVAPQQVNNLDSIETDSYENQSTPEPSSTVVNNNHPFEVTEPAQFPGSKLYSSAGTTRPGIVMLHGSEGGAEDSNAFAAEVLAAHGFNVLTLCWFDCPGRPALLHRIPLDYTVAAIQWLKSASITGTKNVGLFGVSRGAEQAVLIGSLLKSDSLVKGIFVHAPSDRIVAAYNNKTQEAVSEKDPNTGATIYGAPYTWKGTPLYGEKSLPWGSGPKIQANAYPGPMFLSHGTQDELWSVQKSYEIERQRKSAGKPTETRYWQGEGHILGNPAAYEEFDKLLVNFFQSNL